MPNDMELNFENIITDYLRKKSEEDRKELKFGKYSASSLGICVRKNFYSYLYPSEFELSGDKLRIFAAGNAMHEWIAKVLANNSFTELIDSEKELAILDVENDILISGRLDDLIMLKNSASEERIIVEVKSTKSLAYLDAPQEQHLMQVQIYLKALSTYNIKKAVLLYIEKNSLKTRSFDVYYDHALFRKAIDRARTLHGYLLNKTLPPAEAKLDKKQNYQCGYCEFRERCDSDCHDAANHKPF